MIIVLSILAYLVVGILWSTFLVKLGFFGKKDRDGIVACVLLWPMAVLACIGFGFYLGVSELILVISGKKKE